LFGIVLLFGTVLLVGIGFFGDKLTFLKLAFEELFDLSDVFFVSDLDTLFN